MSSDTSRMDPVLRFFDEHPEEDWAWAFRHSATGDDPVNALALFNLALLAYSGQKDVERFLGKWGFDDVHFLSAGATEGFAARVRDPETDTSSVFVSYRGTEPSMVADWLSDVQYHQVALNDLPGLVHGGFARAMALAAVQTNDAISGLAGDRLYFTGHSMGGALAVLAAAVSPRKPTAVYTYGQPRVGDAAFSDAYDRSLGGVTFRYVNNSDVVPHLPPGQLPAPFPPPRFPHLPAGLIGLRQDFDEAVGAASSFFKGERFADLGQLRMFIDGQPVGQDMAVFRARDPFTLAPSGDPFDAVRARLILLTHAPDGFLDHDPVRGYLPRLRARLPA
jgi:triacylglycerol lipase